MIIKDLPFFCSWSGGKDSCMALYFAMKQGGIPKKLITMMTEKGERSRSHGLSIDILKQQAISLNIPLITSSASWDKYENEFISIVKNIKNEGIGIGVFGDIDIEEHKEWVANACNKADVISYHPLWHQPRKKLIEMFIDLGFKATIVAIKDEVLDKRYLGMTLNKKLIYEFEKLGIDAAGENGEYHSVVTNGPIFKYELSLKLKEQVYSNGYWFQNISLKDI